MRPASWLVLALGAQSSRFADALGECVLRARGRAQSAPFEASGLEAFWSSRARVADALFSTAARHRELADGRFACEVAPSRFPGLAITTTNVLRLEQRGSRADDGGGAPRETAAAALAPWVAELCESSHAARGLARGVRQFDLIKDGIRAEASTEVTARARDGGARARVEATSEVVVRIATPDWVPASVSRGVSRQGSWVLDAMIARDLRKLVATLAARAAAESRVLSADAAARA